ncbi:general stress protein CsbD [Antarctobacter heliothermus]|uniref:General stress protein CsbD n=1 Tax=Antarctobacter heliothermus TaxID=74033 RepID=A0A222DXY0_9RHOB|nr:CsbD family protein [Antarctobacter heliothermus]ASP18783.1 general stress protein CsbD [Antarctobacter heliothermus]MBT54396.1 CsbD family protein [Mameliella sp.]|tara:strand:- start:6835 stop:7032 length:198 start_codon:yes stop_codon:yes gene_type:complete
MDNDRIEGKWTEIKGRLREAYGTLTDDELEEARGNREQLEGKLQQRLGKSKDEAREALDSILDKV